MTDKHASDTVKEKQIAKLVNSVGLEIHHYTSISVLMNILKSQELWLGSTATMNDKSEIINFISELHSAVSEDISQEHAQKCESFFEVINKRLETEYPFAMCFSTEYDDASQWERYGDHGCGVCITFDVDKLANIVYDDLMMIQRVFYEYDIRDHEHYKTIKDYIEHNDLSSFSREKSLMDNILICAYFHKHHTFKAESEIRMSNPWTHIPSNGKVEFEYSHGIVRRVLKLLFANKCSKLDFEGMFKMVTIGPRSTQNEHELSEYIKSEGFVELANCVRRSACPLR